MELYSVDDSLLYEKLKSFHGISFPGIYQLYIFGPSDAPLSIPRLMGSDQSGTLYIGASSAVPNRIGNLRKSIAAAYKILLPETYSHLPYVDPSPHQTGRKIERVGKAFPTAFPFTMLRISVTRCYAERPLGASKDFGYFTLEEELLHEYEVKFGERPPLNG